jgi:hypothetical protein
MTVPEILTPRLCLRGCQAGDLDPMAANNADPRVGEWLGGVIGREQTAAARLDACAC